MEKVYDKFTKRVFMIEDNFSRWILSHEKERFSKVSEKKLVDTSEYSKSQRRSTHY